MDEPHTNNLPTEESKVSKSTSSKAAKADRVREQEPLDSSNNNRTDRSNIVDSGTTTEANGVAGAE